MSPELPRSLAEDLRARDDGALAVLLAGRPDLLTPVPSDVASLAARAGTRASVVRALERLDLFVLQVVDALCVLPEPTSAEVVEQLLGADPTAALATLRDQALVYGPPDALVVLRSVRELVGSPAGLGPPVEESLQAYGPNRMARLLEALELPARGDPAEARREIAAHFGDQARLTTLLDRAPAPARDALASLTWDSSVGRVEQADRLVDAASARSPVEWLLARGLLVATSVQTVVVPREVGLHLRSGRLHLEPRPEPPVLDGPAREQGHVDRAAAGAAQAAVRQVEDLLELWGTQPPRLLRTGGVGVRDRARTAAALDLDEPTLAVVVETAWAAGLVGAGGDLDEVWLPTPEYDGWLAQDTAARWAALAEAWLDTTRVPGLTARRDARGRALTPLGPDIDRADAPRMRRATLGALAEAQGRAVPADAIVARFDWQAPRRGGPPRSDLVHWTLSEAEWLGLTGRRALSTHGRALLSAERDAALAALRKAMPEPLDHVLLQADLTAVAPGPLTTDLAHRLRLVADVESTGGATVYRFTPESVRRALDAGWSADDVLKLLESHSRTPVPQPLRYLVEDIARRFGAMRVGTASAYLRSDDETIIGEIIADRRTEPLRLRRLAPTVLVAQAAVDVVVDQLHALGYAPAVEGPDGALVVLRPDAQRAPHRRRPPLLVTEPPPATERLLDAAVRAIRAGDRALTTGRGPLVGSTSGVRIAHKPMADVLAALVEAAQGRRALWIGYVNAEGHASQRVVEPISVGGGYVSAFDHLRDEVRTFALHRITGVAELEDD